MIEDVRERPAAVRQRGRPRDPSVEPRVFAAARLSVGEIGVAGASLSAIADRAGVGKATVHRRWGSMEDLLAGAVRDLRGALHHPPQGPVRARLAHALADDHSALLTGPHAPFLRCMLFAAHDHPDVGRAMRAVVIEPRTDRLAAILATGREAGEVAHDSDVRGAADALMSAHIRAMVVARPREAARAVEHWVEGICVALAPRPGRPAAGAA